MGRRIYYYNRDKLKIQEAKMSGVNYDLERRVTALESKTEELQRNLDAATADIPEHLKSIARQFTELAETVEHSMEEES
jgi:predicted  nucleic acid-binding Zn-ribbon protein